MNISAGFSPKGVKEVPHLSDGGPFFFHVVKTMYFNSHKNIKIL